MIKAPGQPAPAGGLDDPRLVRIGYQEGVVVAAEIVRPGRNGRAKLAVLLDKRADQFDRRAGGAAALQGQAHEVHAQQTHFARPVLPVLRRRPAEGFGRDGLIADRRRCAR